MKTLVTLAATLVTFASLGSAHARAKPVANNPAAAPSSASTSASTPESAPRRAPAPDTKSSLHFDAEVDPTAYVLDGYSVHLGVGYKHLRVDLGAYAMKLPTFVHGQDEFEASFDGFGVKVQYFPFAEQTGGFIGVDAGISRPMVAKPDQKLAERNTEFGVGINFGWRFDVTSGFYATTWLGLGYTFNPHDVTLGDSTFEASHFLVFPAVHLGYQFQ